MGREKDRANYGRAKLDSDVCQEKGSSLFKAHELRFCCAGSQVIILGSTPKCTNTAALDTDELLKTYKHIDIKYEAVAGRLWWLQEKKHVRGAPVLCKVIGDYANDGDEDPEADYDSSTPRCRNGKERNLAFLSGIGRVHMASLTKAQSPRQRSPQVHGTMWPTKGLY